jgi:hypothetical protein
VLVCSCGQGVIVGIVYVVIEENIAMSGYLYHFVTALIFAFVILQWKSDRVCFEVFMYSIHALPQL